LITLENKICRSVMLIVLVLMGVLLSSFAIAGAWASPSQNPNRQTVPPVLTPMAHLPVVVKDDSSFQSASDWPPDRYIQALYGPFPSYLGADGEPGSPVDRIDGGAGRSDSGTSELQTSSLLCRLGVDAVSRSVADYPSEDIAQLRAEWYFNWRTSPNPQKPNGMRFAQSVFVKQWKWKNGLVLYDADASYAQPYTYTVQPSIPDIKQIATNNPGSLWLLGNEIERRDWETGGQCEILPEVYAWAYHEIYTAIKAADPTARVANGSIIVPTPLRLQYMTRMWDEYRRLYGEPMPVDVWHIHTYLGPEKRDYWGIDIPAGIDADVGMFYFDGDRDKQILVNKDFSYVPDLVRDFRAWMKERGQQDKPLVISEFGVSMPDQVMEGEFTPEKIRDEYMYPGLAFMQNAKDPALGYPADEYRLVQSVWWWSMDGDRGRYNPDFEPDFSGNLLWSGLGPPNHSPYPMGISTLGSYWIGYTSALTEQVNVRPLALTGNEFSVTGEPVTVTIGVQLGNAGNVAVTQPFSVTVYDSGEQQIGSFTVDHLAGCGEIGEGIVTWRSVDPGAHPITVQVDSNGRIEETDEDDNEMVGSVLVATYRVNLPIVLRSS